MDAADLPSESDLLEAYQQAADYLRALRLLAARTARLVALSRAALADTAPLVGRPVPAQDPTGDC